MQLIIGAILGFLATLASAQIASWAKARTRARAHKAYLGLEFAEALKALDAIRTAYEHQGFYDFLLINILDRAVENLQVVRQQTYLIRNRDLQTAVFAVTNRLALLASDMRGIQDFTYKAKLVDQGTGQERQMTSQEIINRDKLVSDKRNRHMMEILELKRETKELEKRL